MDRQEFELRTQMIKQQVDPDLFAEIEKEVKQDPRVVEVAENMKKLRISQRALQADQLVEVNRDLIDSVRQEVLERHGIHVQIEEMERQAEERRQAKLKSIHRGLKGNETDEELLQAFALSNQENRLGEHSIESPLFDARTKLAFEAYIKSVRAFDALVSYNQMFGVPTKNVSKADALRTEIHNTVAKEVSEDLGLDFEVARRLVAKIRDSVMPDSGETETYSKSILRLGRRLSELHNGDAAEAVEDEIEPILGTEENNKHSV